MHDQQIIELIKNKRHTKAFAKLYRYFPAVKKLITSKGGSKDDALDIYQDALVILCRKIEEGNFVLTASLNTYLYSVCRFLWNDELKRRGRKPETAIHENFDAEEVNLSAETENKFQLAEKVMMQLGEKCLKLLNMFYIEDMSMKVIAKKLGFDSENVAKNQKYKCLERAKLKLKEMQTKEITH